jgi:hypothetical protein
VTPGSLGADAWTMTLEAFADTIVPGEKRSPDDHAIAGADDGPGAVAAGAIELVRDPAAGIVGGLDSLIIALNAHARTYAAQHSMVLDESVPPFVALPFNDRTTLLTTLTTPGHPEKDGWIGLALFCNMAFDTGAHMHTADAIAQGHPGLAAIKFSPPDADGLWRFPHFSYGRALADRHPLTTASGDPS